MSDSDPTLLFFDGACNLCNAFVDFCMRNDPARNRPEQTPFFRYAPLQGDTAERLIPQQARSLASVVVLTPSGEVLTHARAALFVLSKLHGVHWRIVSRLGALVPSPLANAVYNLVATNRYALFGRRNSCRVPTLLERGLFLP